MNTKKFKEIFTPSLGQIATYAIFSLAIFILVNFSTVVEKIKDQAHFNEPAVRQAFEMDLANLSKIPALNLLTIIIFWSTIGLVIYTIFWLGITILTQARNEIVVETDYVNRGSLKDRIKIPLIQISLLLVLLFVIVISLSKTFPMWLKFFGEFLLAIPGDWLGGLISLSLALLGAVVNLYLIRVLVISMLEASQLVEV